MTTGVSVVLGVAEGTPLGLVTVESVEADVLEAVEELETLEVELGAAVPGRHWE